MTEAISADEKLSAHCSVGSCQRHGKCMYLNHPRCPAMTSPSDNRLERVARKLAMHMFDTWGDAEGVVWAGLSEDEKGRARKAASEIIAMADLVGEIESLREYVAGLPLASHSLRTSIVERLDATLSRIRRVVNSQVREERELRWQPIETAPKDGTKRILYFPPIPALDGLAEHICIREDNGGPFRHPTHWMKLPKPPALSSHPDNIGDGQ